MATNSVKFNAVYFFFHPRENLPCPCHLVTGLQLQLFVYLALHRCGAVWYHAIRCHSEPCKRRSKLELVSFHKQITVSKQEIHLPRLHLTHVPSLICTPWPPPPRSSVATGCVDTTARTLEIRSSFHERAHSKVCSFQSHGGTMKKHSCGEPLGGPKGNAEHGAWA